MAIFYKKIQRNPINPEIPKKWYICLKSIREVKEKEISRKISEETILKPKEVELVLHYFQKKVIEELIDGKTVTLADLGTFMLTATSCGTDTRDEAGPSLIKKLNIRFLPSRSFRKVIRKIQLLPVEKMK